MKKHFTSIGYKGIQFRSLLTLLALCMSALTYAQGPTISYPTAAADLTRAYGQSNLTVKLVFNAVCNGTVRIGLPASVTYAGTVAKSGGTAGVNIAYSGGTAQAPEFSISGVTAIGDEITFTVARQAGCGALASAKDSVYFIAGAGCSDASETVGSVNTYNLLAPTLSLVANPAMTNAVLDTTATRTHTVMNGGNGALDTLRFYVVYPGGGIENSSGTNTITANGTNFTPSGTSGDTLFYKIFGATLFGGDNLLTTGETVTITEPIRVNQCNAMTYYGAYWGINDATRCQMAHSSTSISMAIGVPNFNSITGTRVGYVDKCTPFDITLEFKNNGTGNPKAAAMRDLLVKVGEYYSSGYALRFLDTNMIMLSNPRINGTAIPSSNVYWNASKIYNIELEDLLTSDPDGAGVGLEDLDGDGYYDDLVAGKSFTLTLTFTNKCNLPCGYDKVLAYLGATFDYRTACANKLSTRGVSANNNSGLNYIQEESFTGIGYLPANTIGGTPFRFQARHSYYTNVSDFDNVNTRYRWKIALTPGFSVSGTGNPKYGTTSVSYSIISGGGSGVDTIEYTSSSAVLDTFGIDLVYTCGTSGAKTIYYALEKIDNISTGCMCNGKLFCASITTTTFCPSPCPAGPSNYIPTVRRADGSLGWTDYTLSTRQTASAISAYDLSKALYLDTILIYSSAKQNTNFDNLHLELILPKTTYSPTGLDKLTPIRVISQFYRAGTLISTCTTSVASMAASTSTVQDIDFDLSACVAALPGGTMLVGDSVFSIASYVVATNAGLPQHDIQSGERNFYYSLDASSVKQYCHNPVPEMYLTGTYSLNGTNAFIASGCNNSKLGSETNYLARRFDAAGQYFQNEYRPAFYIDSIIAVIPTGYDYVKAVYQPNLGGPSINPLLPTTISGKTYKYVNPGTWPVPGITVSNTYGLTIPFTVAPTCATVNNENINFKFFIRDYYYAYAGAATPSGLSYEILYPNNGTSNGKTSAILYNTASQPEINLSNLTGTVQSVFVTEHWDIRISNPSLQTAPYIWIAIPNHSNITVSSVQSLPSLTTISPIAYAGGQWYQLSTSGLASGDNLNYRINFTYTNCSVDSLKVYGGWNCSSYPADPSAYTCGKDSLFLVVDPKPSQVQLSMLRQPGGGSAIDLCTTDSMRIVINSAQAANLISPYLIFYPPTGLTVLSPVRVEYPRGSGDYQNATLTPLGGGGYKIDLTSHSGIGTNGILGTVNANPSYVPLGADREAVATIRFSTDCDFVSGTVFNFNVYGKQPCGADAIDNGSNILTSALNITGAGVLGGAGLAMTFGGATTVSCGTPATLSCTTTPTTVASAAGDTVIYTLPLGMGYAGALTAGFTATTSGGGGAPVIVKIPMPAGTAAGTAINYNFDVICEGGGCGAVNIQAAYQRNGAILSCGGSPCPSSSRVIIANNTSPDITLQKPSLALNNVQLLSGSAWLQAGYEANAVRVVYTNNGTEAYSPADTIEFFCNSSATTPFAKKPLTKSLAIGASDSDTYTVMMPMGACSPGDEVVVRLRTQTASGTLQCLCNPSQYAMAGVPLPLGILSFDAQAQDCAVNLNWKLSEEKAAQSQRIEIERSQAGGDFERITQLGAKERSYIDVSPSSGIWLYRIKVLDHYGKAEYTRSQKVQTQLCEGSKVNVYPNPAQDKVQVVLQGSSSVQTYVLYDMMGKRILEGSLKANTNNTLDLSQLAKGSYRLSIFIDGQMSQHAIQLVK